MSAVFNFAGKVALITGSSSGIGAGIAKLFAKSGAQVVLTGTNASRLSDVAQQCHQVSPSGQVPLQVVADVSLDADLNRLVYHTIEDFGKLDVLVNNAGALFTDSITAESYVSTVQKSFDVNLNSVLRLTQLCVPHLEQTRGNIVNISSISAFIVSQKGSPYSMAKIALNMFTKSAAVELGSKRIRVNAINPGAVRTQVYQRRGVSEERAQSIWDKVGTLYPVGRAGLPEDIANAVLFLASDASSFTTGTVMVVDGGHTAANIAITR